MSIDSDTIRAINDALSHPGIKARLRRLWPGWLWTASGAAVIFGAIQFGFASFDTDQMEPIITAVLASFIAILALGAIVVTLLWPQYNDAIDRMQNLLHVFAAVVFENHGERIRAMEFLTAALHRLEEADDSTIRAIWKGKYKTVDSVVLQLVRYLYSLSWYQSPIPINYFKSELEKRQKFSHLVPQMDVEITMKSIAMRLQPEVLLEIQLDLFNPVNYLFHTIDGSYPTDLSNTLYYKMLVSGFINLRMRVRAYRTLTTYKAYILYTCLILELVFLICALLPDFAEHVWLTKTLIVGFLVLSVIIVVSVVKLLLPNHKQMSDLK